MFTFLFFLRGETKDSMKQIMTSNRFKVFLFLLFLLFGLFFSPLLFAPPEKDLCSSDAQPAVFRCCTAVLSALEVCTLMVFIDLNNIRGCGDVIKAEITSA